MWNFELGGLEGGGLILEKGCKITKATHRHQSEDGVDDADADGGIDGLTDAGLGEDCRGVVKNLWTTEKGTLSDMAPE